MTRPEKHTYIYLSTAHLTPEDASFHQYPIIARTDYSLYVVVPQDAECLASALDAAPPSMQVLIRFASEQGASLLIIDCDEEPLDDLPVYDW